MLLLSEHQSRILHDMIALLDQFRRGDMSYYDLVGAIEGALDAGEFRDADFIKKWYDFWTPLESVRAQQQEKFLAKRVEGYVADMRVYLEGVLGRR